MITLIAVWGLAVAYLVFFIWKWKLPAAEFVALYFVVTIPYLFIEGVLLGWWL